MVRGLFSTFREGDTLRHVTCQNYNAVANDEQQGFFRYVLPNQPSDACKGWIAWLPDVKGRYIVYQIHTCNLECLYTDDYDLNYHYDLNNHSIFFIIVTVSIIRQIILLVNINNNALNYIQPIDMQIDAIYTFCITFVSMYECAFLCIYIGAFMYIM